MDKQHYDEMKSNVELLIRENRFDGKNIYLFGHCNATEELVQMLALYGYTPVAILDNNTAKHGNTYENIPIVPPRTIMSGDCERSVVCIASRAYAAMAKQLRDIGYNGDIEKLAEYNTFSEYSLSQNVIEKKYERANRGIMLLESIKRQCRNSFLVLCPFNALGDVYYAMSYLKCYLDKSGITDYTVVVVGNACGRIVNMFDIKSVMTLSQNEMDELVQAVLYTDEKNAFIAHHDRPYTNKMIQALKVKFIRFEDFYKYGVYGLDKNAVPIKPTNCKKYCGLDIIDKGKTVILSPYSKSVAGIDKKNWFEIISYYKNMGYKIFTNVAGEEEALAETAELRVSLDELQSAVEYAGVFIGARSGVCDIIKDAKCKKVALYPDCRYSDTKWKVIDFFGLDGWENIEVKQI